MLQLIDKVINTFEKKIASLRISTSLGEVSQWTNSDIACAHCLLMEYREFQIAAKKRENDPLSILLEGKAIEAIKKEAALYSLTSKEIIGIWGAGKAAWKKFNILYDFPGSKKGDKQ